MSLRRRALLKQARLPAEYQEVEYLESYCYEFIDTGFYPSSNTNIRCKIKNKANKKSGNLSFGIYNIDGLTLEEQAWGFSHIFIVDTSAKSGIDMPYDFYSDGTKELSLFGNQMTAGELSKTVQRASVSTISVSFPIFNGYDGKLLNNSGVVIEYFEIYDGNSIVRNLIPCYRKSDNKPGMYDLCGSICPLTNSPFYINAGIGEFTVGPDVN